MSPAIKKIFPTWSLGLLLGIGLIDLIVTAWLHAHGMIVELNPIMRPFIEHSEWTFAFVKGMTLVGCWYVMAQHYKQNKDFVHKSCLYGSVAYGTIWLAWFIIGS